MLPVKKDIEGWLSASMQESSKLLFSVEEGFVVWLVNTKKIKAGDELFRVNARKFALDSDLIIGAFGKKGGNVAVIARERQVPVMVLPPLRAETLVLLATTTNESLAQSYERHNVFAGKLKGSRDVAPIYLSDELWHTEYGNLLNITDQMLKSWSENGSIEYIDFDYPKPVDWAFNDGALADIQATMLTYNWNTKGAGYIVEDDKYDVYAINRTGSLPVSYFPDGMEGQMDDKVYDAEELAYDFFSQLNNPELVRVVQYAAFYQIMTYFKGGSSGVATTARDASAPDYSIFEGYIENLFRLVDGKEDIHTTAAYNSGNERYVKTVRKANDVSDLLKEYLEKDPYGGFENYLEYHHDLITQPQWGIYERDADKKFRTYVDANADIIRNFMAEYRKKYGEFPFAEAARYAVTPHEMAVEIAKIEAEKVRLTKDYNTMLERYFRNLEELDEETKALESKVFLQISLDDKWKERMAELLKDSPEYEKVFSQSSGKKESDALEMEELQEEDLYSQVMNRLKKVNESNLAFVYTKDINAVIDKWNRNVALLNKISDYEPVLLKKLEPYNKKEERLFALQLKDKEQLALGALNWLLTDPATYDVPAGDFFADRLTGHRQWTKSPSIVCSYFGIGYGGHNLDAHVTPIKVASKVPAGKCKISFENGNRVISVAKADRKRVTPQVLRQVERRVGQTQNSVMLSLPPEPPARPKTMLMAGKGSRTERGFSTASVGMPETAPRSVSGMKETTVDGFIKKAVEQRTAGSPSQTIRIKRYTEREALVEMDGQQYLLDRSVQPSIDFSQVNPRFAEEVRGENQVFILTQNPDAAAVQGYKAAQVEIICPKELAGSVRKSLQKMLGDPAVDAGNSFKILRNIKMDLQMENLEFNAADIRLEDVIFSHVMNRREDLKGRKAITMSDAA